MTGVARGGAIALDAAKVMKADVEFDTAFAEKAVEKSTGPIMLFENEDPLALFGEDNGAAQAAHSRADDDDIVVFGGGLWRVGGDAPPHVVIGVTRRHNRSSERRQL